MKLVSLNMEGDRHLPEVTALLKKEQGQVVCLQECFRADLDLLKSAGNYQYGYFQPMAVIGDKNRYGISNRGEWGLTILSNYEFKSMKSPFYDGSKSKIPTFKDGLPNSLNRYVFGGKVDLDGQSITILNTHFTWSSKGTEEEAQLKAYPNLLKILDSYSEFVLCGDFNSDRRTSTIYQDLAKRYIDWLPIEIDSTLDPILFRKPNVKVAVDTIFSTRHYKLTNIHLVGGVSDHQAVLAELIKIEN